MKNIIVKIKCDRCGGEEVFDKAKSYDDLYLHMNKHGWERIHGLDICEKCSDEFDKMYEIFMKKLRGEENEK